MTSPVQVVRVLVVADNPFARAGIAALVDARGGLNVVGQTAADHGLVEQARLFQPDVIVCEVVLDSPAAELVLAELKDVDVPTLLMLADQNRAADALAAGARGVLLNRADGGTITAAVMALAAGLVVMSAELQVSLTAGTMPLLPNSRDDLTAREHEVLKLLAEGLANKQIAARLSISEHTVKFHVNAIMGKLSVQSRTEAVVRATRLGLIAL